MNKYDLLNASIIKIDELVDARGVAKCQGFVDVVGNLSMLRDIMEKDDEEMNRLREQIKMEA